MAKQENFSSLKVAYCSRFVVAGILVVNCDENFGQKKVELIDRYVFNFSTLLAD